MTTHEQPAVTDIFSGMERTPGRLGPVEVAMFRSMVAVGMIVGLAACATPTKVRQIDRLESVGENPRILIMEPDIKHYL
jgi:hypothetical protein